MNEIYLGTVLIVSIAANIFAYIKIKSTLKQPIKTIDAQDLLHDITRRGRAIVRVEVLDPENLFVVRRGN